MPSSKTVRCVILPCAGKGTRLGLPYPKELHVVLPGKSMIDFTLERLEALQSRPMLVVVLSPEKVSLGAYLLDRCKAFELRIVGQTRTGFVGALASALPHLAEANLILMPDQAIDGHCAIEDAFSTLEGGAAAVVLAHRRVDRATLGDEGALATYGNELRGIAEKPGPNFQRYDSAWCGMGFRRESAHRSIESLRQLYSIGKLEGDEWAQSPLRAAPVIFVKDYVDLGVWQRLTAYQRANL